MIENDQEIKKCIDPTHGFINKTSSENEAAYYLPSGQKKFLNIKVTPILLDNGTVIGGAIIFRDITEQKKSDREILYLTFHDKLTGIYNRRFFEDSVNKIDNEDNLPISIIVGDLNGLKLINDAFGHSAGDALLIAAGEAILSACRKTDMVARWGGDEYIILMPMTTQAEAEEISEGIYAEFSKTRVNNMELSISLGVAAKVKKDTEIQTVIEKADDLMYRKKFLESRSIKNRAVKSIINALHASIPNEEAHSMRVSNLCKVLGSALKLNRNDMTDLILLAYVHDIGKATIDPKILNKTEKLSLQEIEIIKQHSEKGYNIISASPDFSYLANEVLAHHENWDGTGYPSGLKGTNIPYLSRVIRIADSYDEMTSKVPYEETKSKEQALNEIQRCSGTKFDPDIVEVFLKIMQY